MGDFRQPDTIQILQALAKSTQSARVRCAAILAEIPDNAKSAAEAAAALLNSPTDDSLVDQLFGAFLARPKASTQLAHERWKEKFGVWIVRTPDDIVAHASGFYALLVTCTHLGCTPNYLSAEAKFKCPCHGSGFRLTGINFEGPAPRPLERARVVLADDGQLLIDKSRKFQYELGQWTDPEAFLKA